MIGIKKNYTQEEALKVMQSGVNVFLTGLTGTGKSYIIKQFIEEQQKGGKQVLVCAPTGIAALNVGGITMHQAFSVPIPAYGHYKTEITKSKIKAAMAADIIIIDEISICRNDVFEYFGYVIDFLNECDRHPQIIVVGDMFQLPPVVPEQDVKKLKRYGFDPSGYCFTSRYWKKMKFKPVTLNKVIRQQDKSFVKNLGLLRIGDPSSIKYFNNRVLSDIIQDNSDIIQICSTNAAVQEINDNKLSKLDSPACLYTMKKEGFCPKETVAEDKLVLKEGARVMFIANDVINKKYVNGEMGTILICLNSSVVVKKDNGEEIEVVPYVWKSYDIKTTNSTINKKEIGSYSQLPLKLAYCVTMHKTQGQTYDKAVINPSSFACGQLYVALSRVKSIDGVFLTQPISTNDIKVNDMVFEFYTNFSYTVPQSLIEKRKKLDKAALDRKKKKSKSNAGKKRSTTIKNKKTKAKTTTASTKRASAKKKTTKRTKKVSKATSTRATTKKNSN